MIYKHIGRAVIVGIILTSIICLPTALAQPGPTPGYSVLGKVTNADGSAASGASIIVTLAQTQGSYTTTTNATGWYIVYNIEASVGDELRVEASLDGDTGRGTALIRTISPIYEVNITLEESGFAPPMWLLLIAAIVIVIFLAIIFLRGGKKAGTPPESPPKRRRN